jgi:sulfur carrier protein ThiS
MIVRVDVHLHGGLLRFVPDTPRGGLSREFPTGARVADVLASFDFLADRRVIVGVDGQTASPDDLLIDGARIDLVPPIAGGSLASSRHNDERTV